MSSTSSSTIAERLAEVEERICAACERSGRKRSEITLVAVSKKQSMRSIHVAHGAGVADFGESYVMEYVKKSEGVNLDLRWHFIGHLQRNKAHLIVPSVHLVHSLDTERLAQHLDQEGEKIGRRIPVLLQINTSGESSKYGCYPGGALTFAEHLQDFQYLDVRGLMTMAAFSEDPETTRPMFRLLNDTRNLIQDRLGIELPELSMGMTNDFEIAVEEGSTIVRIGTAIFGERD